MLIRAFYLLALFWAGVVGSSVLAWLTTLHPYLRQGILLIGAISALVWVTAWGTDDVLAKHLGTEAITVRGALLGILGCVVVGVTAVWIFQLL